MVFILRGLPWTIEVGPQELVGVEGRGSRKTGAELEKPKKIRRFRDPGMDFWGILYSWLLLGVS